MTPAADFETLKPQPLVSVIIAACNAERFLAATLRSAIAQTYRHIEIIVVDDGSRDTTASIAARHASDDPRIRLVRRANGGAAVARNSGLAIARGEYVAILDADDIWHPEKIEKQVACFAAAAPDVGLVYCWTQQIDASGNVIDGAVMKGTLRGHCLERAILKDPVGHGSASMIRRDAMIEAGGFWEAVCPPGTGGCEDQMMLISIAERYAIDYVPEILVGYRQSPESASKGVAHIRRVNRVMLAILRARYPTLPRALLRRSRSHVDFWLATILAQQRRYFDALAIVVPLLLIDPGFARDSYFRARLRHSLTTFIPRLIGIAPSHAAKVPYERVAAASAAAERAAVEAETAARSAHPATASRA